MPLTRRGATSLGLAGALFAALSGLSETAHAQVPRGAQDQRASTNGDGMDTHLFRPAVDSKGFFSVNGSDILGAGNISFGLVLDYGRNIMRTRATNRPANAAVPDPNGSNLGPTCTDQHCLQTGEGTGVPALVRDSFQGTFSVSYGIANKAIVGLSIPVVLMTGNEAYDIGPDGAQYNSGKLNAQTLSTLALHGKYRLTRVDRGPGVSFLLQAGIPLGGTPRDLGADPGLWFWPHVLLENRLGATKRFHIGLDAGYRGHTGKNPEFGHESFPPNGAAAGTAPGTQLKEGVFEYSNLGTFGLGLSYRVLDDLDLVGETYGSYELAGASDSKQKLSEEFLGGIKLFVEQNSYLMMGGGSRAFSTGFEAADLRLVLGFVFEPSIGDRDGDGYKDDQDQCPDEPEDFDGFQDEDGCPDPDNDNDGIPDVDDRCINEPEDRDG
ncbi:MAG TPA: OmpA family protein, partial [Polyangiaceae bacterium]